jgi:hypothetical protein
MSSSTEASPRPLTPLTAKSNASNLCGGCIWARFRCADPPEVKAARDDANADALDKPNRQNQSVAA